MHITVSARGVSKKYMIGARSRAADTLRDELAEKPKQLARLIAGGWSRAVGQPLPGNEEFWALRDLSFELNQGQRLGIIGRNGAGKSTLLKILSRITEPTSGSVELRGRVASLLEVGTGFHPELSGRENVFLNGAILGMKHREILSRFDEIVEFSEVEKFIDTPVKHYSSGMTVRLAFAVAAHLQTDILIADEVLAVGDLAFQRKSLGKMQDAAKQGRTVLFVSHNLTAVRNLCQTLLFVENGRTRFLGPVEEGIAAYERSLADASERREIRFQGPLSDRIALDSITYKQDGEIVEVVDPQKMIEIEVRGKVLRDFRALELSIGIFRDGFHIGTCHDAPQGTAMREGTFLSRFHLQPGVLKPGRFSVGVGAVAGTGDWGWCADAAVLDASDNWGDASKSRDRGPIGLPYSSERIQ